MMVRLTAPPMLWAGGLLLLLVGLWRLDASPLRLVEGLGRLGWLLVLMVPPSSGGVLWELLEALLATVPLALRGPPAPEKPRSSTSTVKVSTPFQLASGVYSK